MGRLGIATAGNWIVDRVKLISHWPEQDTLARIEGEARGTGGGAYNALIDLHNLGVAVPLTGIGCIGDDADGAWIRADLAARGLDDRWIRTCPGVPTSYTEVMTVVDTGRRTFFHNYGANAELRPEQFPFDTLEARVAHLAYLLVLPGLDAPDPEYGVVGARVLAGLRARGILTCLDIISEDSPRVRPNVLPALPHTDCLIVNELEAQVLSGVTTRDAAGAPCAEGLCAAAAALLEAGVQRLVVVHLPEGGYARARSGEEHFQPSLQLPAGFIKSAVGAGDAFAAGMLYGLHEGWELDRMLELAVATATACLRHHTCCAGVGPLDETLALLSAYPPRESLFQPG